MDTIQVLCRIGMSVTLIAVLLSIAAAQEAKTPPPETKSASEKVAIPESEIPAAEKTPLASMSNHLHPFIVRELPLLHDQLVSAKPYDDSRRDFAKGLMKFDIDEPQIAGGFTRHLIKNLSDRITIEVNLPPDEVRLDWLRPMSEFLASLLNQLDSDGRYDDAINQLNLLESQISSMRSTWPPGDQDVINDIISMVAYYRLRCDPTIQLATQRGWRPEATKIAKDFMTSFPGTKGKAAATYYIGYVLEHQQFRGLKPLDQMREGIAELQPEWWYQLAEKAAPKSIFGKSAHGALWRLNGKETDFTISGGLPPGAQINLKDRAYRGKSVLLILFHIPPKASHEQLNRELSQIAAPYRKRGLEVIGVLCHPPSLPEARLRDFPITAADFYTKTKLDFPCMIDSINEDQSISVRCGYPLALTMFLLDQFRNVICAGMPNRVDEFLDGRPGPQFVATSEENSSEKSERVGEVSIPDISGKWRCPLFFFSEEGNLLKKDTIQTCTIRRHKEAGDQYVIEDYSPGITEAGWAVPRRMLWTPERNLYSSAVVFPFGPERILNFVLEVAEDDSTLTAKWLTSPTTPLGNSAYETVATVSWQRLDEATKEQEYLADHPTGKRAKTRVAEFEANVRTKLDKAEAAKLRNEIEVYERRANDLASSIARLHLKAKNEPFEIDLLTKDLKAAVSNAYLKKSQLEQLRIEEMQRRVNQLQNQHRRRIARQTEIIDQQVRKLVSHAKATSETENSDRSLDLGETDASEVSRAVQQFDESRFDRAIEVESQDSKRSSTKRSPVKLDRSKAGMEDARSKSIDDDAQFKSDSSRSYNSLLTSLVSAQDEINEAEANFNRSMKLYEQKIEPFDFVSNAKRKLDTANLKQQVLTEDYQATMRDLRLQLAAARFKWEESKELVEPSEQAFAKKQISKLDLFQARQKSRQDELAYQRIEVQLELFEKLNAFLQLMSPLKPPSESVPNTGNTETVCWGMHLKALGKEEVKEVLNGTKFRAAMRILKIDPNSPAGKANIAEGDFLVGLGDWETANSDNVAWIQRHLERGILNGEKPDVRFVLVRGGEQLQGTIEIANPIRR